MQPLRRLLPHRGQAGTLKSAGGQGVEKAVAVVGGLNPPVQDDDGAPVHFVANQPPEPLPETQHGSRHLIVVKRIAAQVAARFDDGIRRHRKGQPAQQQAAQDARIQVDAFPETGRTQQRRAGFGVQPVNQLAGRAVDALGQHADAGGAQLPPHLIRRLAQRVVRGEQRQHMAVQRLRHIDDGLRRAAVLLGAAPRVGQIFRHQQQRITAVVERAVHQQLVAVVRETDPFSQKVKTAVRGQRGAGQHDAVDIVKQLLAQDGADGQRRGVHREAAPLHHQPLDLIRFVASENRRQIIMQPDNSVNAGAKFGGRLGRRVGKHFLPRQPRQFLQRLGAFVAQDGRRFPLGGHGAPFAAAAGLLVQRQRIPPVVVGLADAGPVKISNGVPQSFPGLAGGVAGGHGGGNGVLRPVGIRLNFNPGRQRRQPRQGAIDAFQFPGQSILGNLKTQLPTGLIIEMMRLIDDQPLVVGYDAAAGG